MSGASGDDVREEGTVLAVVASERVDVADAVKRHLTEIGVVVVSVVAPSALGDPALPACDIVFLDATDANAGRVVHRHLTRSTAALVAFTTPDRVEAGATALDAGVDDLVVTSASHIEVGARVRAVLRRRGRLAGTGVVLTGGPVIMDVGRARVTVAGRRITLTGLEFKLLAFFLMHPDEPVTRDQLLREVWGHSVGSTAVVTVTIRRLREKIEADPADPMLIRTLWGVGYRFAPMP